ncbi:hypothetical protein AHAS_Ahas11G0294000 [Arachis hypogaea]
MRSKSRTIPSPVEHPSEIPKWNYDGSSTGQTTGVDSEVYLYPQAIFKDPFRGGDNILVICDSYTQEGEPIPTNKRRRAAEIFSHPKVVAEVPWFGIEQEYTLLQKNVKWPLGWPLGGYPGPQGPYYCGTGADKSFGRDIADAHYKACLYAGINISGTNGEVMPGQHLFCPLRHTCFRYTSQWETWRLICMQRDSTWLDRLKPAYLGNNHHNCKWNPTAKHGYYPYWSLRNHFI